MDGQYFTKLYDVQDVGVPAMAMMGAQFMALGGLLSIVGVAMFRKSGSLRHVWFFAPFFVLIGAVLYWGCMRSHKRGIEALRSGRAAVVSGTLDVFEVRSKNGRESGRISADNHTFFYDDDELTMVLWKFSEPRGPLRVGCGIRIWHVRRKILRVEMASNCTAGAPP